VQSRVFRAPRELVWKVWTDPQHVAHWWGPNGFTITNHEMDVRPGGSWRFMMHGWGQDYPNKIDYDEVIPHERLAYRHGDFEKEHFKVVVLFEEQGGSTKVTMRSLFPSEEALAYVVKNHNALEGGQQTLGRLDEYLGRMQSSDVSANPNEGAELVVCRTFKAPRKLVFETWSKAEHIARWFGPQPYFVKVLAMDFRPGGRWRFMMCDPDGNDTQAFGGEYREILAPERIVMTDAFEAPGSPVMVWTVTFEETAGKTALTVHVHFDTAAIRDEYLKMGMEEGLTQCVEQIEGVLASMG
jgi:uncharacterized protein YndB with AHSA1/START domain